MVSGELEPHPGDGKVLRLKVLSIFGTRPEAIKMAPVIRELRRNCARIESIVCVTGQHREMLDQVLGLFDLRPDIDLDLMEENQDLAALTSKAIAAVTAVLERIKPEIVLVQGDTTTALAGALAAFYKRVPVAHVEAGLRTRNRYSPFPEELDRRLVGVLATYHFAPTETAAAALRGEGVPHENIFVTGNTVIDTLLWTVSRPPSPDTARFLGRLGVHVSPDAAGLPGDVPISSPNGHKLILVTAHRRENFGRPLEEICGALRDLARRNQDVEIVYLVHMNPNVRQAVIRLLANEERVRLLDPLPYEAFSFLMKHAYLILTDSGGIQEEAPSLGKPVLVLRTETERPEAVEAGTARVVGVDRNAILQEAERILRDREEYERVAKAVNPYGDGHAAERIVKVIVGVSSRNYTLTSPVAADADLPEIPRVGSECSPPRQERFCW